jgi:anti-anti-sigma factor
MPLDRAAQAIQGWAVQPAPDYPRFPVLTTAVVREPGAVRLMLRGELDMSGVVDTEAAVRAAADLADGRLTIDLSELAFLDVFGARALLRVADEVLSTGRSVVIANPNRHVRRLFELITDLAYGRSLVAELVRLDDT